MKKRLNDTFNQVLEDPNTFFEFIDFSKDKKTDFVESLGLYSLNSKLRNVTVATEEEFKKNQAYETLNSNGVATYYKDDKTQGINDIKLEMTKKELFYHVSNNSIENKELKNLVAMLLLARQGHEIKYNEKVIKELQQELGKLSKGDQKRRFINAFEQERLIEYDLRQRQASSSETTRNMGEQVQGTRREIPSASMGRLLRDSGDRGEDRGILGENVREVIKEDASRRRGRLLEESRNTESDKESRGSSDIREVLHRDNGRLEMLEKEDYNGFIEVKNLETDKSVVFFLGQDWIYAPEIDGFSAEDEEKILQMHKEIYENNKGTDITSVMVDVINQNNEKWEVLHSTANDEYWKQKWKPISSETEQQNKNLINEYVEIMTGEEVGKVSERGTDDIAIETSKVDVVKNVNNYKLPDDETEHVILGDKNAFDNLAAIELLKKIEQEDDRKATNEEKEILSKYVGWGGLVHELYYNTEVQDKLEELLAGEEHKKMSNSILNAHYTSLPIIDAMYKGLQRLGVNENVKILEPSCATGRFIGRNTINNAEFTGIEIDDISARIAKKLYPDSNIHIQGFQDFKEKDFDIVIGNVPFGDYSLYDEEHNPKKLLIHDYFINKSLDLTREGGIVALITSKGTLDKMNAKARLELAGKAELLGAIRLPDTTFESTSVLSDILFLQKKENNMELPKWIATEKIGSGNAKEKDKYNLNTYYVENEDMILGTSSIQTTGTRYGKPEFRLELKPGQDLKLLLEKAIEKLPENVFSSERNTNVVKEKLNGLDKRLEDSNIQVFNHGIEDDRIYFNNGRYVVNVIPKDEKQFQKYKDFIELKELVNQVIDSQLDNEADEILRGKQVDLENKFDSFINEHGLVDSRKNRTLFINDMDFPMISELVRKKDKELIKSDFFTERTIRRSSKTIEVDNVDDALILSMNRFNRVDIDFITDKLQRDKPELLDELLTNQKIYIDTDAYAAGIKDKYFLPFQYLQGNVQAKIDTINQIQKNDDNKYLKLNERALWKIMPERVSFDDIKVNIGSNLLKPEHIRNFINSKFVMDMNSDDVSYNEISAQWNLKNKKAIYALNNLNYGTRRLKGLEILERKLNGKNLNIYDKVDIGENKTKTVLNNKETILANEKGDLLEEDFQEYINDNLWWEIEEEYNHRFNSNVNSSYKNVKLTLDGLNPNIKLKEHQKEGIAQSLYGGNTLLAHEVGAGKSYEMIVSAMEKKRLGIADKPCFVLPKAIISQFEQEFRTCYPHANILTAQEKDFTKENRKKFIASIALGNYDSILMSREQFEKIPVSAKTMAKHLQEEYDRITDSLEGLDEKNYTVKQLVAQRVKIAERIKENALSLKKDNGLTFEQTGIDALYVDEAHGYKNLYFPTRLSSIPGINPSPVQRTTDMLLKIQHIDEINKGNVVFATATPVSNSISELFTMQRYLDADRLKENGTYSFDAWAKMFATVESRLEIDPTGQGFRYKERFRNFNNIPELMNDVRSFASIVTAEMLDLERPNLIEDSRIAIECETDENFEAHKEEIKQRLDDILSGKRDENHLVIFKEAKASAIDMRFIDDYEKNPGGKIKKCADQVAKIYYGTTEEKSTQAIFSDIGTPTTKGRLNLYEELKGELVSNGIPTNEIAFIHDAETKEKKAELMNKLNNGDIRVVIGSTSKLGTGTNFQDKLIALHHLDVPYRPSDMKQREGRILRQGNENGEVGIYNYITKGSIESYLYQMLETKQKFVSAIMNNSDPNLRTIEDCDEVSLSFSEFKALANDNPLIQKKMELDNELSRLTILRFEYQRNQSMFKQNIEESPKRIEALENRKDNIQKANILVNSNDAKIILNGEDYTNQGKKDIGEQIKSLSLDAMMNTTITAKKMVEEVKIGQYKNLDLYVALRRNSYQSNYILKLDNNPITSVDHSNNPQGLVMKFDNALKSLPKVVTTIDKEIADIQNSLEFSKAEISKEFEYKDRLSEVTREKERYDDMFNVSIEFLQGVEDENKEQEETHVVEIHTEEEYELDH